MYIILFARKFLQSNSQMLVLSIFAVIARNRARQAGCTCWQALAWTQKIILSFVHLLKQSNVSGQVSNIKLHLWVTKSFAHTCYLHVYLTLLVERLLCLFVETFACKTLLRLDFISLILLLEFLSYLNTSLVCLICIRCTSVNIRPGGKSHIGWLRRFRSIMTNMAMYVCTSICSHIVHHCMVLCAHALRKARVNAGVTSLLDLDQGCFLYLERVVHSWHGRFRVLQIWVCVISYRILIFIVSPYFRFLVATLAISFLRFSIWIVRSLHNNIIFVFTWRAAWAWLAALMKRAFNLN